MVRKGKRRNSTRENVNANDWEKVDGISFALDRVFLIEVAVREATEFDESAVEFGVKRPSVHTIELGDDDGDGPRPINWLTPDSEPANAIMTAGLDGGMQVIYRREIIIEGWLVNIAMLFTWHTEPHVDLSTEDGDRVQKYAEELYRVAYPFLASHADTVRKLMGRVRGIGDMPEHAFRSHDSLPEPYVIPDY